MQPQFITGSPLLESAWAAGIFCLSILFAWLILFCTRLIAKNIEKRFKSNLITQILYSLSRAIFILLIIEGLLLALSSVSYLESWSSGLISASVSVLIVFITYGLGKTGGEILTWYLHRRRVRRKARIDESLINLMRRVIMIIVCAIGLIVLLDYLAINITPFIASLGIGGLAIALALQPTLGNFFASTQLISDRVVRIGDYIELDNGTIRGYVTDVGWRSTRIRTPYNNIVTIPNSRLADSILTNFYSPNTELGILIRCGVSYSSDLVKVEKCALEVANQVVQELDEAVKTFTPVFRYDEFGDSNIDFWIWVQAKDRMSSFIVKSEIIKRLKARFDKEGIMINYPARLLTFESPEDLQFLIPPDVEKKQGSRRSK
jgi:small-conductance mechanosensitive channel